jgi:hypothetical protein
MLCTRPSVVRRCLPPFLSHTLNFGPCAPFKSSLKYSQYVRSFVGRMNSTIIDTLAPFRQSHVVRSLAYRYDYHTLIIHYYGIDLWRYELKNDNIMLQSELSSQSRLMKSSAASKAKKSFLPSLCMSIFVEGSYDGIHNNK